MAAIEDVDYQLFWKEVIEAVKLVELNHGLTFDIELGNRHAIVQWCQQGEKWESGVEMFIYEVEPKQPTLLVP